MDPIRKLKAIILILVMLIVFGAFFCIKTDADELHDYKVYGQNKSTGLMVAGHAWETDKEGNLLAKVWDEFEINDECRGNWVGYGVAQVVCENGVEYVLEVVEK
jgi:hypothetical protein